ncbi:MAG: metallophosphoesterase, partial [Oceanococcaceae bacterium]
MTGPHATITLSPSVGPLHLLPERAIWWPVAQALLVADVHWGKGAALRRAGVAVPQGSTADDLMRLDALLARYPVRQLIVLGDLVHRVPHDGDLAWVRSVRAWRERHAPLRMRLVLGNHDRVSRSSRVRAIPTPDHRNASSEPPDRDFVASAAVARDDRSGLERLGDWELLSEGHREEGLSLWHHPPRNLDGPSVAGHWHPVTTVRAGARQRVRLPVFWICGQRLILPSFGGLTGGHPVPPDPRNQLWG